MFPKNFVWGVATSAYQIEGATVEDGKGMHIWDVFTKEPGKIFEGHTGDVACDHYHRYREDVAIMKEMGIKAYRFSIDWSRILPEGCGKVNEKGIEFYNGLIDALTEAGIQPYVTLYHWELPYELYKKGGWMNQEIVEWFGDYAALVAEKFSDRVTHFITFNEPQCFIGLGFLQGEHAPGVKSPIRDTFVMAHNVLKAHGRAVQRLREKAKQPVLIGIAPTSNISYPQTERPEDVKAARQLLFGMPELENWGFNVSWWSDPVVLGRYPEEGLVKYEAFLPNITEADMKLIAQPIDFYGQNIYNGHCVRMGNDGKPEIVKRNEDFPRTAMDWPITPECLYWGPKFLQERYGLPIYITENGLSCRDMISADGKVHDPGRIEFLHRYLGELERAIMDGVDVSGYFQWSLLDNFEWCRGYGERFGLIYVDYQSQKRIWKDSAYWYREKIQKESAR